MNYLHQYSPYSLVDKEILHCMFKWQMHELIINSIPMKSLFSSQQMSAILERILQRTSSTSRNPCLHGRMTWWECQHFTREFPKKEPKMAFKLGREVMLHISFVLLIWTKDLILFYTENLMQVFGTLVSHLSSSEERPQRWHPVHGAVSPHTAGHWQPWRRGPRVEHGLWTPAVPHAHA